MPVRLAVYEIARKKRSKKIARALAAGARRVGYSVCELVDETFSEVDCDLAAFYGYEGHSPKIMAAYIAAGKPCVFVDLGYWGRHDGGRFFGYHKVAVNARHPTEYFQRREHGPARARKFGHKILPWRATGDHILIAGMSGRAAESIGYKPEEWERWAIAEIRKHTKRPIVYRPKPSWKQAREIDGVGYSAPSQALHAAISKAWAVVTHHSNVAIDGLIQGVPAFCWDGVAKPMALQDLSQIQKPYLPEGREQWLKDVAWCQWTTAEMERGDMWRHLKAEGLVP